MQKLLDVPPLFMFLLAVTAVLACVRLAYVLKKDQADRLKEATTRADSERRREEKRREREERELKSAQEEEARMERKEQERVEEERQRVLNEGVFLPRTDEALQLADRVGTLSLVLKCLVASKNCLSQDNCNRLFEKHRGTILKTAVNSSIVSKDLSAIQKELSQLCWLLRLEREIAPLLLDFERDCLLQNGSGEHTDELSSQMKVLTDQKEKKVNAIQLASIDPLEKERLIEELEMALTDEIAKLIRNSRT
jgi:hypothetical protein